MGWYAIKNQSINQSVFIVRSFPITSPSHISIFTQFRFLQVICWAPFYYTFVQSFTLSASYLPCPLMHFILVSFLIHVHIYTFRWPWCDLFWRYLILNHQIIYNTQQKAELNKLLYENNTKRLLNAYSF